MRNNHFIFLILLFHQSPSPSSWKQYPKQYIQFSIRTFGLPLSSRQKTTIKSTVIHIFSFFSIHVHCYWIWLYHSSINLVHPQVNIIERRKFLLLKGGNNSINYRNYSRVMLPSYPKSTELWKMWKPS